MTYDRPMVSVRSQDEVSRRRLAMALAFLALIVSSFALTACNTASGFGQDVENTGDAISDTAKDTEDAL